MNTTNTENPQRRPGAKQGNQHALRHGLFAKEDLIEGEDYNEYQQLTRQVLEEEGVVGAVESQLAARMVGLMWRLGRITCLESAIWGESDSTVETLRMLKRLAIYESRLSRELERVRKEFRAAQANRRARTQTAAEAGAPDGKRGGARAGKVEKTISPRQSLEIGDVPFGGPDGDAPIECQRG